jgi:hypothetical protein
MKIFSIGGIYSLRGSPETIEKPSKKNKKRNPAKKGSPQILRGWGNQI